MKKISCQNLSFSMGKKVLFDNVTFDVNEKEVTEEDKLALEKQINLLKNNIARRTNLLNNPGYVNKAPASLVESERIKLEEEKQELERLKK